MLTKFNSITRAVFGFGRMGNKTLKLLMSYKTVSLYEKNCTFYIHLLNGQGLKYVFFDYLNLRNKAEIKCDTLL